MHIKWDKEFNGWEEVFLMQTKKYRARQPWVLWAGSVDEKRTLWGHDTDGFCEEEGSRIFRRRTVHRKKKKT